MLDIATHKRGTTLANSTEEVRHQSKHTLLK
jgi:hypothetical protein